MESAKGELPEITVHVDPDGPAPLAAARPIIAPMFDLDTPDPAGAPSYAMSFTVYDLGAMQMATCTASASIFRRSPALIALAETNQFILQFYRESDFVMTIEGVDAVVQPGTVAVLDLTRTVTIRTQAVNNLSLVISRDALLPLVAYPNDLHGLVLQRESEANVALVSHLEDLWRCLPKMTRQEAEAASRSTAGMIASVAGANARSRIAARAELRKNQLDAICRWIEDNLANRQLGPIAIIRRFHITRATLFRMFEPMGGIRTYILERRLKALYRDLHDPALAHEKIGTLIYRRGFNDHASAGRIFRATFGMTPGGARAAPASRMPMLQTTGADAFRIDRFWQLYPDPVEPGLRATGNAPEERPQPAATPDNG